MASSVAFDPPLRAEVVGSLLRPRSLKQAARQMHVPGEPAGDYQALLEREIAGVIARQEAIGLRVVTDGELARSSWFGFFFEAMEGFSLARAHFTFKDAEGRAFEWPTSVAERPIRRLRPILLREYQRASGMARTAIVKATMPTPSAFHFFRLGGSVDPAAYPDISAFFDDLVAIYRAELADLARAGCRYVQFDEVPIAMLCDPGVCQVVRAEGGGPQHLLDVYVSLMQRILADRPATMWIGVHLCRGNFRGRWMAAGGYEPVAEKLFNHIPADVFLLEYDSERAGNFEPLRFLPREKRAVLGLVSTKCARLEEQSALLRRIDEAAKIVAPERLGLSTQCGFASVAGGNTLSEDEQWAKLGLVVATAERAWGSP
jgi:5-methyltetrahydropteroyltriglutamate--homocysteine methyltransferase